MTVDYLIVGTGLAGISFAELASNTNKSVLLLDNNSQQSSSIAAGIYNPVILKRFTEVWESKEQLLFANNFYNRLEIKLKTQFDYKIPIFRKFNSIEEQNNWFLAADKPNLCNYLCSNLIDNTFNSIDSPFHFGKVNNTGFVDSNKFISKYRNHLESKNAILYETFCYNSLFIENDFIIYKDIKCKHIIFAEGFGLIYNPFFNYLPLDGCKGELLLIFAPDLNIDFILNASIFIVPLGNSLFKIGATYNWTEKNNITTLEAKCELVDKLSEIISCDFEIINQYAGIRPTVKDRKPLIGSHPLFKNMHILNGLGTRGVMLAPYLSQLLLDNIELGIEIPSEVSIERFIKLYNIK